MIYPLFEIKHGPLGSDGLPISHEFVSLGEWDIENFADGFKFCHFDPAYIQIQKDRYHELWLKYTEGRETIKQLEAENKQLKLDYESKALLGRLKGRS